MNTTKLTAFVNNTKATLSKHRPAILIGVGIAGWMTTTALAVQATPKAIALIEERKEELYPDEYADEVKLPVIEVVKTCWKCYAPAVITATLSTACLIGSHTESTRRATALAAAYQISEKALTEYKDAVIETIGEKKERSVREKVAEKSLERHPVNEEEVVITGQGNTLCHDAVFGSYFRSSREIIERAVNNINRQIVSGEMYASLNDFYDAINLPHIDIGDLLGWNLDDGEIDVEFDYKGSHNGEPTLVIRYNVMPKYDFYRFV